MKQVSAAAQSQLEQTFLFRNASPGLIQAVIGHPAAVTCAYQPEEIIFSPGHYRRSLGFLLSGSASVYKLAGKNRLFMSRLEPGAMFGAAALFHSRPDYVTEIRSLTPAEVFFLPQAALEELFRQDFTLVQNYLAYLADRILFLNQRLEDLARPSAKERVLHYLVSHSRQGIFTLASTWQELSAALGLSRASLYRILDRLQQEGMLQRQGKTILLSKERIEP